MARDNSFTLFGELDNAPIVLFNEESKTYRVTFTIMTLRKNGRKDYPRISIYGLSQEKAKQYVAKLKPGSFVEVRGMVTTKMVKKPVKCGKCGQVCMVSSFLSEIVSYGNPLVLQEKIDPVEIVDLSNNGTLIGVVCMNLRRMDKATSGAVAQFQVAVNRRQYVGEQGAEKRTDYPWIKVFGNVADECMKRLHKGSQVYVYGPYQTRDINKHIKCEHCGEEIIFAERVGEIAPTGVEFLNECLFDAKKDDALRAVYEVESNEET